MNQRIANKKLKNNKLAIIWMYHWISDGHISGHSWLHDYQYKMIMKHANNVKFKQIRRSKYYSDIKRIEMCCITINKLKENRL